jgi:hypothetical protein
MSMLSFRSGTAVLTMIAALAVFLPAQEAKPAAEGFFIAASGHDLAYKSDLDGKLALWHFDLAFNIPRLEKKTAIGLGFGYIHASWMWELSYLRSNLTASADDRDTPALFQAVQITGRTFLLREFPVKPYVSLGISVPWLRIDNGAELNGQKLKASYIGLEAVIGAGLAVRIGSAIFLHGGAAWRLGGFFYATGEGPGRDITNLSVGQGGPRWGRWLRSSSLGLTFGLGFVF